MSLALAALLVVPALGASNTSSTSSTAGSESPVVEPIDRRPYLIRAWLVTEPSARIDARGRDALIASFRGMVRRFVGPAWDVEFADGAGPFRGGEIEELTVKQIAPLAKGVDKAWLFHVGPGAGDGYMMSGREFDVATAQFGLIFRRPAPYPADAARSLFRLALDMFAPYAEIGESAAGGVSIIVQGALLPAANPIGRVVVPGSVFQPLRLRQRPDGSVIGVLPIKFSYLRVDSVDGATARCSIVSGLRDPLSKRFIGTNKLVALGLKPSAVPTRMRFTTGAPDKRPAAGYTLTVRSVPNGQPREVGTTDREGRIVLPPGYADSLVIYRLMAGDIEPLVEFPGMPGESAAERVVRIRPLAKTVTLESRLIALKDEIVDLVATRSRLEARLKRLEIRLNKDEKVEEVWNEIKTQLDLFKKLKSREAVQKQFNEMKETAEKEQAQSKTLILTRTAIAQFLDAEALISRYLDDDLFKAYEDAYLKAHSAPAAAKTKGRPGVAAKAAAIAMPKPQPQPQPKAAPPAAAQTPPAQAPAAQPQKPPAPARPKGVVPF